MSKNILDEYFPGKALNEVTQKEVVNEAKLNTVKAAVTLVGVGTAIYMLHKYITRPEDEKG